MNILILNCGSSTLKFGLFAVQDSREATAECRLLARGIAEPISAGDAGGRLKVRMADGSEASYEIPLPGHKDATRAVLAWLGSSELLDGQALSAVGHRVVHGGQRFSQPVVVCDDVADQLEGLAELAPLHNRPALDAVRACRDTLGTDVPMVAVFDTAFHHTLPPWAAQYAIPRDLTTRLGIRRFGFHGIAHQQMAQRCASLLDKPLESLRAVTLQLGNGCSATAVRGGQSTDTSMGLTPLEGLMMGTRSGNVDPSLVGHVVRRGGLSLDEVERCLNTQSGLLGVSGLSSDMRTLLEAERQGHERAALAIEMYCHRVRQYIGAYLTIMGGADAIVFGGGIGENAPQIRERICADMSWCGLTFDPERNLQAVGREGRISADGSMIHAFVVTVNEEQVILQETVRVLAPPP